MIMVTAPQLVEIELSPTQRRELFGLAREVVVIEWFGRRIAACFRHAAQAESFRKRYQSFVSDGTPDMWSCAVQDGNEAGEPIFWTEPGAAYRYPAGLQGGVIAFLADAVTHRAFFDVNPAMLSFHAAAVRVGDAAVAISAVSTGGKSTTAIACVRRGMALYTDERCVLIGGRVHPFPRALNIRQGGLELLCAHDLPDDSGIGNRLRARGDGDWEAASFADVLGDMPLPKPAKLEVVFFIDGHDSVARVVPLSLEAAIVRLLTAALCGPKPGLDRVAAATALCRQARMYALTTGTPDDTALLIEATTTKRARPLEALAV
ncbi:MAG: hypothetical protein M3Z41_07620 [Candidatus Eremiobacteraeota bacterium]|nr:hypothetical protein [Candidatus Eremiobacteraeota bacterium]